MLYGPDFAPPGSGGARSDFVTLIGPINLTATSIMNFDHLFSTEATFDGGVIEVSVGTPDFNSAVFPENVTTFDLGDYMVEGGYNDNLNGSLAGVFLSALQGRRAFTGSKGLHHTRIALRNFAPGGRACNNGAAAVVATTGVLLGNTNGDGVVNAGDVQQTRSRSGQLVVPANFRADVNVDGTINSGDALVVRSNSGNSIAP
jgi:hypothetical protein